MNMKKKSVFLQDKSLFFFSGLVRLSEPKLTKKDIKRAKRGLQIVQDTFVAHYSG
jgi:hypothetical protein